jgi:hypothetical protein
VPPAAGYKGLENQLYRVEIHRGGPQGTATFKWSRDNATVATRVTEIHGGTRLVVESLGRDDVLGFHPGDWIEILDDWHELHGLPGLLRRIRPGERRAATRSILLTTPAGGPLPGRARPHRRDAPHAHPPLGPVEPCGARTDGVPQPSASAAQRGIPVPPQRRPALELGVLATRFAPAAIAAPATGR